MRSDATRAWVREQFATSIVPTLVDYIRIPNKSPAFDANWEANGHMQRAVTLLANWAKANLPDDATLEVLAPPGRTPLIFIDVPGRGAAAAKRVMLYGHLDKQPEMEGWREGLGPWTPVREGDKLYGRGGADDGYAIFASLTAINALRRDGVDHAHCAILIEACEESGSTDLMTYVRELAPRLGSPSLVVCLDSGCGNYEQMWATTSLRGIIMGTLRVRMLHEGVHSGDGTGVMASTFRIARTLLERIEDAVTGEMKLPALHAAIPEERVAQAQACAQALGNELWEKFPRLATMQPTTRDGAELVLRRTWRPTLSVTGADGLPPIANGGNVLRPETALKLSFRAPPTVDAAAAGLAIKAALEAAPPYGAQVVFELTDADNGWNAPPLAPWLGEAMAEASQTYFGKPAAFMGEGGSIPFIGMLGAQFPGAQFCITGVLGPGSNAHGPNEFLHLPTAEKLTLCIADVLAAHATAAA